MTSSTGTDWREKYLDALDEQERQQQLFEQQQESFRRALVRVSLAAEGQDPQLDASLSALRNCLRQQQGEDLDQVVEGLETVLLKFEARRSEDLRSMGDSLTAIIASLQAATRERAVTRQLKGLAKDLNKGICAATLPTQLERLLQLQTQALTNTEASTGGLLGRWLGLGDKQPSENDDVEDVSTDVDIALEGGADSFEGRVEDSICDTTEPQFVSEPQLEVPSAQDKQPLEGQLQTRAEVVCADETEAQLQRPVHEPAFSQVSDKVFRVLSDLLDRVEPVACTEQKSLDARQRLARGLNWFELVPTLEDIRDLVLQAYLGADAEYREHLQQMHGVLEQILTALGGVVEHNASRQEAEQVFEQSLSQQLGSLGQSVQMATEVDTLKREIDDHLSSIQQALSKKQSALADSDIGSQLAALAERVKTVESEAGEARQELETQRHKALTDALTGLPNREAYNERAHHELSRWQRYGRPLSMAVCDIDHFKRINDNYGHQAGDRVLQVLSKAISLRLREVDFMARYGGEEFVILLPETASEDAYGLVDKIRQVIAETPFRFKQQPVQVTLSMGVVGLEEGDTIEKAFARADSLLYKAKKQGRNCCLS